MVKVLEFFDEDLNLAEVARLKHTSSASSAFLADLYGEEGQTRLTTLYNFESLKNYLARGGNVEENAISRTGIFRTSANLAPLLQMLPKGIENGSDLEALTNHLRDQQASGALHVGVYVDNNEVLGVSFYFQD